MQFAFDMRVSYLSDSRERFQTAGTRINLSPTRLSHSQPHASHSWLARVCSIPSCSSHSNHDVVKRITSEKYGGSVLQQFLHRSKFVLHRCSGVATIFSYYSIPHIQPDRARASSNEQLATRVRNCSSQNHLPPGLFIIIGAPLAFNGTSFVLSLTPLVITRESLWST